MAVAQQIDPATYERLAVQNEYRFTELRDGVLVEKPAVSVGHVRTIDRFARQLDRQLDARSFLVSTAGSRLRAGDSYVIPDLVVLPTVLESALFERDPIQLGVYDDPLPLIVEVWSPSTGDYDVRTKLPLYQTRGDQEIWFVQPFARRLTAWVRRDDGAYTETVSSGGTVTCTALPGVRIDLDALLSE